MQRASPCPGPRGCSVGWTVAPTLCGEARCSTMEHPPLHGEDDEDCEDGDEDEGDDEVEVKDEVEVEGELGYERRVCDAHETSSRHGVQEQRLNLSFWLSLTFSYKK